MRERGRPRRPRARVEGRAEPVARRGGGRPVVRRLEVR